MPHSTINQHYRNLSINLVNPCVMSSIIGYFLWPTTLELGFRGIFTRITTLDFLGASIGHITGIAEFSTSSGISSYSTCSYNIKVLVHTILDFWIFNFISPFSKVVFASNLLNKFLPVRDPGHSTIYKTWCAPHYFSNLDGNGCKKGLLPFLLVTSTMLTGSDNTE